jgi:hypothetical protein
VGKETSQKASGSSSGELLGIDINFTRAIVANP